MYWNENKLLSDLFLVHLRNHWFQIFNKQITEPAFKSKPREFEILENPNKFLRKLEG